jgi:mono/diheme cytochrome c family protein
LRRLPQHRSVSGRDVDRHEPHRRAGRYNDKGPNLRGVASKVDKTWLYNWIKDPKKWWPETRMPNLRLSDQDAADITAYLTEDLDHIFKDVPTTWKEKTSPVDLRTLQEQARWFFQKMGRTELERRMAGNDPENRWNDPQALLVAVGQEWVKNQGCFSCHEIRGLENAMPIGTELSNWGSKTVDKLDFGIAYRKDLAGLPELDHEYREQFLERKLQHPRFFDLEKVKNPKEKLRMPWFDFTDEQVQSLMTFVLGLVDDEVQLAKMVPTPEKAGMDRGMRALRQKNCVACHVVDAGRMSFEDEHGSLVTVDCELLPLPEEKMPPRMTDLEHLKATLAQWRRTRVRTCPRKSGYVCSPRTATQGDPARTFSCPSRRSAPSLRRTAATSCVSSRTTTSTACGWRIRTTTPPTRRAIRTCPGPSSTTRRTSSTCSRTSTASTARTPTRSTTRSAGPSRRPC